MKRFIIALILALLLSSTAHGQAATVDLNKATINWTFAPGVGSGILEKWEVRCGQTSGVYTKITNYAASASSGNIRDVITGSGNWFCVVAAMNALSEVKSTETPFVAAVGLSGTVTVIIK
jgi:hypothetical protein